MLPEKAPAALNGIQFRLRNLYRRFRLDNPGEFIYVFNHIPKAGGTAARFVFGEWHTVIADYRKGASEQLTRAFIEQKLDLGSIRRPAFVSGHYGLPGARLHERYPQVFSDPRFRLITFLREPLETALSTYFYVKKLGRPGFSDDLDKFLAHYRTDYAGVLNCEGTDYAGAIARYWFVGITERFPESIRLLSRKINQRNVPAPMLNVTSREIEPSDAAVQLFRKNNCEDYAIYAAACERFECALEEAGMDSRASRD